VGTDYYTKIERLFSSVVGVVHRFAKAYVLLISRPFFAPFYLTWGYTSPERREIGPVTTALTSYFLSFLFFLFLTTHLGFANLNQIFARGLLYPEMDDQKSAAALALAGADLTTVLLYAGMTSISAALAHFDVFGDDFEKLRDDFRTAAMYATANIPFALPLVIGIIAATNVFGIDPGKILYIIVHGHPAEGVFGFLEYIAYGSYIILFVMGLYAVLDGMSLARHFLGKGAGFASDHLDSR
jgi:hypothetical protein